MYHTKTRNNNSVPKHNATAIAGIMHNIRHENEDINNSDFCLQFVASNSDKYYKVTQWNVKVLIFWRNLVASSSPTNITLTIDISSTYMYTFDEAVYLMSNNNMTDIIVQAWFST